MRLHHAALAARSLVLALGLAAAAGAAGGCGNGELAAPDQPAGQATVSSAYGPLTIYSGRAEALVAPLLARFEKDSGLSLRVRYAGTSELAATLLAEGQRSPADVFFAQDATTLAFVEAQGALAPLPDEILERVDPRYRSASGGWIGTSGRARVLAYNTEKLRPEQLPGSIDELIGPRWRGRVGWSPENASFQAFVAAMIQLRGAGPTERWLRAMQANQPRSYPSNTPLVLAVASGEVDVALTNHYYLHRLSAEHGGVFPVRNHYFGSQDAASMVNVSGVGILKSSKNPQAAERLVELLLDEEAQRYFAETNYELPLAAGIAPRDPLPSIQALQPPKLELTELQDLQQAVRLLRATEVLP
jgi:iron(III) transport system substrate-binding protein